MTYTEDVQLGDRLAPLTVWVTPGAMFAAILDNPETGPAITSAEIRFGDNAVTSPTATWTGTIVSTGATFAIAGTTTALRTKDGEGASLWINGVPKADGSVRLRRV